MQAEGSIQNHRGRGGSPGCMLPAAQWRALATTLNLSGRELEIVRCLVEGGGDSATAVRLGLSVHTVHTYLDRIYRKLAVRNRYELILRVFADYVVLVSRRRPRAGRGTAASRPRNALEPAASEACA
ncbi:MAG: helix-turn-helix transcriptional regulator [Planctomycetes bacterium]|nr:helix-turn-helix transcriptional regulator [Planctomycetota bacterium]